MSIIRWQINIKLLICVKALNLTQKETDKKMKCQGLHVMTYQVTNQSHGLASCKSKLRHYVNTAVKRIVLRRPVTQHSTVVIDLQIKKNFFSVIYLQLVYDVMINIVSYRLLKTSTDIRSSYKIQSGPKHTDTWFLVAVCTATVV